MKKVLIANRGEIAIRVARACRVLGLRSVAVYSEADAMARHVRKADEAVCIGPPEPSKSYLDIDRVMDAVRKTGADTVHPGYGFLSENTDFARAVIDAGLTWVGPPPGVIGPLQSKTGAKAQAEAIGLATVPGAVLDDPADEAVLAAAASLGYPVIVKPEAGGGGKGMVRVDRPEDLLAAVAAARRVAKGAFKSDGLFLERHVGHARHIEVQVLGDRHGHVTHVHDRECSVQRRHQKIIEESPCTAITPAEREQICDMAYRFASHVGYEGAGTVEFLWDPQTRKACFLEMNTRIQVEHPVTEVVTGMDLVVAQLRLAAGEPLSRVWQPSEHLPRGHAIEVRLYAEDPANGFLPQTGKLQRVIWPDAPFVRVDAGFETGDVVSMHTDPMLAKIIAWGTDRNDAIARLQGALRETVVHGVVCNLPILVDILHHPDFVSGNLHTTWVEEVYGIGGPALGESPDLEALLALAMAGPSGPPQRVSAREPASHPYSNGFVDPWASIAGVGFGVDGSR